MLQLHNTNNSSMIAINKKNDTDKALVLHLEKSSQAKIQNRDGQLCTYRKKHNHLGMILEVTWKTSNLGMRALRENNKKKMGKPMLLWGTKTTGKKRIER